MTTLQRQTSRSAPPLSRQQKRAMSREALKSPMIRHAVAEVVREAVDELRSPRRESAPSLWGDLLAVDEAHRFAANGGAYSWGSIADGLRRIGEETSEWAGVPMPLTGEQLVIEPRYPWAEGLASIGVATVAGVAADPPSNIKIRNTFRSSLKGSDVVIYEEDGALNWGIIPAVHHLEQDLQTLGCSDAWSLETEMTAMNTLRGLVSHYQFRQYLLTGQFMEVSKRSGVYYLFRRLKPTVAMSGATGKMKVLAALCLHPLAYYAGSWAGALCPTDDVLAHLMLMRGDEHMLWRRANQHAPHRPEAGL